jgi:predicted nucleotide-binding protein
VVAELGAVLASGAGQPAEDGLLRAWLSRMRAEEAGLLRMKADLARLGQTIASARHNIAAIPGCAADGAGAGMFDADRELARWLTDQAGDDLSYVTIDLAHVQEARALAAEELGSRPAAGASAAEPAESPARPGRGTERTDDPDKARRVFVVHGRDDRLVRSFFDLLTSVGLRPVEWETLVRASGSTSPVLGQLVAAAPHLAQATLVLLSPDDVVALHSDLYGANDSPAERARGGQARPNVLFELGLAMMAYPERTVVVEIGQMRPIADLAGLNTIHFDGSGVAIKKVLDRLTQAECPVDYSGATWLEPGRFAGLAAKRRGPGTHAPPGATAGPA